MNARSLTIGLIGPLPPPSGGMANQTRQLARLLEQEGMSVELVQTNAPYRPQWIGAWRGVRALFRFIPFLIALWRAARRVQLFHVMANSGWAWHLFAAPAIWVAKIKRVPVVVNYRGGEAQNFLSRSVRWVQPTMCMADRLVVPSGFLQQVFIRFGLHAEVVPNVVDLSRFAPRPVAASSSGEYPHLIVTRNLEAIYDIETAIRAFSIVAKTRPAARMTIAGSGPELEKLRQIARTLDMDSRIVFAGRLDNDDIGELYREADIFLNSSRIDNMPISILEALASGLPVVSTNVGGIPFVVEHRKTALLVPAGDAHAMAQAVIELLSDPALAARLADRGRESVQQYSWSNVRERWLQIYCAITPGGSQTTAPEAT